jgi:hypothetical protein
MSTGAEELGGGRNRRGSAAAGDGEVVLVVDFELDSLHACVEQVQRRTEELDVASAWREVAGDDGTTVMAPVFLKIFFLPSLSCVERKKMGEMPCWMGLGSWSGPG